MASDPRPIIVLAGPTASGKTSAAIALAKHLPIEVISADARQIYRGLDIGTATPSIEERGSVPHHLIDALDLHEEFSASHFANDAQALFESIDEDKIPLLVGGSGLYVKAAIDGLSEASQ